MTAISTTPITAPDVTNLTATATVKGIRLDWDKPVYSDVENNLLFETEIWVSTTNDRSAATKLFSTAGDTYLHLLDTGLTRYYWIIGNNVYGRTDGAWHPVSSTNGVWETSGNLLAREFEAEDVFNNGGTWQYGYDVVGASGGWGSARSALTTSSGGSIGSGSGGVRNSRSLTAWDTWTDIIWSGYVSNSGTWHGFITNAFMQVEMATPSGTTGQVELIGRLICWNITDSVIEYKSTETPIAKYEYDGSITYWAQTSISYMHRRSAAAYTSSTDQYQMILQLKKTRTDSGSSWDPLWSEGMIDSTMNTG